MATITVAEFATALGTDARTARKFLRSVIDADAQPGKGGRWAIEKREVRSLTKKFATFAEEKAPKVEGTSSEEVDDAPEGDIEPTDEELLAIDAE